MAITHTLLSDEELFQLVRENNDEQAFRTIYRRYDKKLYSYCLRIIGDAENARDVFQVIITTVFVKRASFSSGSFAAWIFTIARNACLKFVRDRKHNVEYAEESHGSYEEEEQHSNDFLLTKALRTAVKQLNDDYREALELKFYYDLSYDEIAETLNIGKSLAKIRVFRAKKILQEIMSPIIRELQ